MDARREMGSEAVGRVGERAAPFTLSQPARLNTPLVFASPHSGRLYPEEMLAASDLDAVAIRRSEDAYVDLLLAGAMEAGIPVLTANYARAYIDVNREPYELDPSMFEDALPAFACARTARVAAGLGSIARVVAEGQEIYRRKLTFADAESRIAKVHRPYHDTLQGMLDEATGIFGMAILVDWHSMPSMAVGSALTPAPDIVLGDRFGAACSRRVIEVWERALESCGYRVARNTPYAGGHTTEFYGKPLQGVHALQIEINRGLYLDERALNTHTGFDTLKENLRQVFVRLTEASLYGVRLSV